MIMLNTPRLVGVLLANGLLRIASSAGGALVGFYLAQAAAQGRAVDPALVGLIGVVANGTEVAGAIPIGVLTDRFSPRVLLTASTVVGAIATQLFGLSGLVAIFFLSRSLESLAAVAGGPAILSHLTDATRQNRGIRGRVMGYYELSLLAGLALGSLVGGTLWDAIGTQAFSVLAVVYLLCAGLFWWATSIPRGPVIPAVHPLSGLRRALHDPQLRRLAPAWIAVNAIVGLWLTHIGFQLTGPTVQGQYLVGRFSAGETGLILLGYTLSLSAGVIAWGFALDRMPRLRVLRITLGGVLMVCLWLFLLNAATPWTAEVRILLTLLSGISLMIGSGFTPAALTYLADVTGESEGRGAALGIYTSLFGLGNALGAGLGGALAQTLAFNGLIVGTALLTVVAFGTLSVLPPSFGTEQPVTPLIET